MILLRHTSFWAKAAAFEVTLAAANNYSAPAQVSKGGTRGIPHKYILLVLGRSPSSHPLLQESKCLSPCRYTREIAEYGVRTLPNTPASRVVA